jgi:hypothetical protein
MGRRSARCRVVSIILHLVDSGRPSPGVPVSSNSGTPNQLLPQLGDVRCSDTSFVGGVGGIKLLRQRFLDRREQVSVAVERDLDGAVTEPRGDQLRVRARRVAQAGAGVAEVVEPESVLARRLDAYSLA